MLKPGISMRVNLEVQSSGWQQVVDRGIVEAIRLPFLLSSLFAALFMNYFFFGL